MKSAIPIVYTGSQGAMLCQMIFRYLRKPQQWVYWYWSLRSFGLWILYIEGMCCWAPIV